VHLKQVDPNVLDSVIEQGLGFGEAVKRGVMCEPPQGVPDLPPVLDALSKLDVDLFAIVEQDLYPCPSDVPLPIAQRTLSYLRTHGGGVSA
jgi:inosose dehydratase